MTEPMESKAQSILTILAALSARGATGTLRFMLEPGSELGVEFLFREGKLLFATSNHPGERLAEFLVRRGMLTGEQARASLIEAKRRGRLFHAYLAEQGIVAADLLQDLLYQRTEELLDVILKIDEGQVVFQPVPLAQFNAEAPGVDEELFGRLLRHRQLWPQLFEQFRDPRLVLRVRSGVETLIETTSPSERKLLTVLDGQRSVSKILERRKNRIDLMILLARLMDAGLVEAVGADDAVAEEVVPEAPAALPPPPPAAEPEHRSVPSEESAAPAWLEPTIAPSPKPQPAATDPWIPEPMEHFGAPPVQWPPAPAEPVVPVQSTGPAAPAAASAAPIPPPAAAAIADTPAAQVDSTPAAPAEPKTQEQGPPIDFDLVPVLTSGMDIARMSITGLMMDDLFLISQIDGRASVRELMWITRMPEAKVHVVLTRMIQHGYVRLQTRMGGGGTGPRVKSFQPSPSAGTKPEETAPAPAPSTADSRQPFRQPYHLALTAYNEQRYAEAEQLLRKSLSLEPRSALIRSRLAITLLERSGQERSAEKLAVEAFEEDPLLGQCLEALGLVRLKQGDYTESRRLLDKAVFLDKQHVPASVRILYELKNRPPQKGDSAEDFWWRVHRMLKLTA